jgi:hypothetical protein
MTEANSQHVGQFFLSMYHICPGRWGNLVAPTKQQDFCKTQVQVCIKIALKSATTDLGFYYSTSGFLVQKD